VAGIVEKSDVGIAAGVGELLYHLLPAALVELTRRRRDQRETELAERCADVRRILARGIETFGAGISAVADHQRDGPLGRSHFAGNKTRQQNEPPGKYRTPPPA
jgi:hypothetical protein